MIAPCSAHIEAIKDGNWDNYFATLYEKADIAAQKCRYQKLLNQQELLQPHAKTIIVNAPGRTELGGNHTDHNHGCILAAAVDLDCIAAVSPVDTPEFTLYSDDYPEPIRVDLTDLSPKRSEFSTPEALIRGVAAAFFRRTGRRQGCVGRLHSTCQPGTGLSSSAAFSILIGSILNFLSYDGQLSAQELALMAQEAENDFFGKPCGLMDQMASSVGRTIFVDFLDPLEPEVNIIKHSLKDTGYQLAVIDTGGSHVELTHEYAAIPEEMQAASQVLGQPYARAITIEMFLAKVKEIRQQVGDRATLRLLHFIEENHRAEGMANFLKKNDFTNYLRLVQASGNSSCMLLQNCASAGSSREQGILLALAMSRRICKQAVCRVHGGGFAGTVQAYVPKEHFPEYQRSMEHIFGTESVLPVRIGRPGACCLSEQGLILPNQG